MKQNIYDNEQFYKGYQSIRKQPYNFNTLLENPALMKMLPEINGMNVLDVGCGAGDFAGACIKNGAAYVKGIDISVKMLNDAREKYSFPNLDFECSSMEDMKLQPNYYDVIVSSLAVHYIEDFTEVLHKLYQTLKTGGTLTISMQHPIYTSSMGNDGWVKNEVGQTEGYKVSRYFEAGKRQEDWIIEGVVMYHRTIADIINSFIRVGFTIKQLCEPSPSLDDIVKMPKIEKVKHSPSFLIVQVTK